MVAVSIAGQALEFEIYVVYKWRGQDKKPLVVESPASPRNHNKPSEQKSEV